MEALYNGEMQLAGWSDSHTGGAKVTFWLPDASDLEVFRTLTTRKGNTAGHRFGVALVEIGDDEQPVQASDKPKGGELAKLAGRLCQNQEFWLFLTDVHAVHAHTADDAALFIRQFCGIKSRSELDHDERAAALFDEHFRRAFLDWQVANP